MKNILVTGSDGFIGSHLVEKLVLDGNNVTAFCMYNSQSSLGWLDTIDNKILKSISIILGDIRDKECVNNAVKGKTHVLHLASLIGIPYSYVAAQSYIETNILGTLNILQASRNFDVEHLVHTSTSEVYGTANFVPISEDHPLKAQSPYAASKIGADQLALSFNKSFGTPISIIRPFNTYGPRQSTRAVIPSIITQLALGSKDLHLGSLTPTRDFNFIEDTVSAFVAVLNSFNTIGNVVNAASSFEVSIKQTAEIIADLMNVKINIKSDEKRIRPENSEVERLFGDNKKIRTLTSWKPSFSGEEGFKYGLKKTIDWFTKEKNLKLYKFNDYAI